jgi:hypothetical protein
MPRIRLQLSEVRAGALPPVCVVCGRTAALYAPKVFSWRPSYSLLLTLLVLCLCWPAAVVVFIVNRSQTRRMTVYTPLCERHRLYWGWRHFWTIVPLLVLVAGVAALAMLMLAEEIPLDRYFSLFLVAVVLFAVWAASAAYLNKTGVRADEITDDEITLVPVSSAFFDMVTSERAAKKAPTTVPWEEYDPYPLGGTRNDLS